MEKALENILVALQLADDGSRLIAALDCYFSAYRDEQLGHSIFGYGKQGAILAAAIALRDYWRSEFNVRKPEQTAKFVQELLERYIKKDEHKKGFLSFLGLLKQKK